MPSSFPIVFGNMVGKVNDGMCVSGGGSFWGVEGTGESDRWFSGYFGNFVIQRVALTCQYGSGWCGCGGLGACGCWVDRLWSYDF